MSNPKQKQLSGCAGDVLYALFFRGASLVGELPSKVGVRELRDAGLVDDSHTATPFGGDNYFIGGVEVQVAMAAILTTIVLTDKILFHQPDHQAL